VFSGVSFVMIVYISGCNTYHSAFTVIDTLFCILFSLGHFLCVPAVSFVTRVLILFPTSFLGVRGVSLVTSLFTLFFRSLFLCSGGIFCVSGGYLL